MPSPPRAAKGLAPSALAPPPGSDGIRLVTAPSGIGCPATLSDSPLTLTPVWLLPDTMVMLTAGAVAVSLNVTDAPGTEAVTPTFGPVGVNVLLARPLAFVTDVAEPSVPLPDETLHVTVWPETATPFWVTLTTRGSGSGEPIVPLWLLPEAMAMASGFEETTRLNVVVRPRGLPVTVTVNVPDGVAVDVVMV